MKSNKLITLSIACVVLAALAGTLYWSNRHPKTAYPAASATVSPTILNINPANVTAFTIKTKDAPPVTLARVANQAWQITAPRPMHADPEQVSMLLSALEPLTAQEVVTNSASDLSQYGLASPTIEIDVTQKGRPAQRLLIGDNTPVGGASYAMVAGNPRIFTTFSSANTTFNKTANDLRDKRLVTLNADQMNRIELLRNGTTIALDRTAGGWALEKPAPFRTDSMAADGLASALADAQMQATQPSEKEAQAAFANATPVATVKVTGASGTQTIEIRKGNTSDYVKSSVVPGIYRADPSLGDSLSKSPDDFRNKQVFDFANSGPDAMPDAIDVQIAGSKPVSVDMVHNAQGWWRDGRKMDSDTVESFISGFRDLTATKFATSGFTTPMIVATITSNGGKRREKVEIAKVTEGKSGSEYLARRANDPSLYVLDAGAVEGVESAATAIEPASR
jgi:Domain of unknown function (DUF4340)